MLPRISAISTNSTNLSHHHSRQQQQGNPRYLFAEQNKTKQNIVYRMMKRVLLAPAIVAILASYTTVVHGFFAVSSGATKILSVGPNNVPLSVVNRVAFSPNRAGNLIRLPMADDDSVSIRRLKCV